MDSIKHTTTSPSRRRLLQKSDTVTVTQEYKSDALASDLLTSLASASGLYCDCNSLRRRREGAARTFPMWRGEFGPPQLRRLLI